MSDLFNNQQVQALIRAFSGQGRTIAVPVVYLEVCDRNHAAAFALSQMVFHSDRIADDDGWFHKSYQDWEEEIYVAERTMRRISDSLEQKGFIETKRKKIGNTPKVHYRVNMEKIAQAILELIGNEDTEPIRTKWPNGENRFGQNGRMEETDSDKMADSMDSDKMADSIRTKWPNDLYIRESIDQEKESDAFAEEKLADPDEQKLAYLRSQINNHDPSQSIAAKWQNWRMQGYLFWLNPDGSIREDICEFLAAPMPGDDLITKKANAKSFIVKAKTDCTRLELLLVRLEGFFEKKRQIAIAERDRAEAKHQQSAPAVPLQQAEMDRATRIAMLKVKVKMPGQYDAAIADAQKFGISLEDLGINAS